VAQQAGGALGLGQQVDELQGLGDAVQLGAAQAGEQAGPGRRSALSASSRFSNTVSSSNTVGFWNLRPMPIWAISFSRRRSRSMLEPKNAVPGRAGSCR
jgi:hypothetical protein